MNLDYADWMDYTDDFSDFVIPAKAGIHPCDCTKVRDQATLWIPAFAGMTCLLLFALVIGCTKQPVPMRVADSATTAKTFQQMEGKHGRTFRGPADILGDTTKNERRPAMVRE